MTKGKQWIRLNKNVELLDTPGILWPKFEDQQVGLRLALIGSIKDEILQAEELAAELIHFLKESYPGILEKKYEIEVVENDYQCLENIQRDRHCLVSGNKLDLEKAPDCCWMISETEDWDGSPWNFRKINPEVHKNGELRSDTGKSVKSGSRSWRKICEK
ncbi:hypothetical protein KGMB01110_28070 [Mediterraneibacter butyricigenes]|uniref:G domain-containing protein n=1 Tax=Mediterraneibacter butyricigenes TaxID=2316025 RepID=A0A391P3I0_9FIRM|nr:hypothetical protein KGMB01110_28070 [Mediterraneibacter butyricigenes]